MKREDLINILTDNTHTPNNYKELGIFKFAKLFFPERFKNEFALIHYKIIVLFFQLLDPDNKYDFERRRYLLIHRQAAKTTITSFLFPTYLIYLKGYKIRVRKSMLKWDLKDINTIVDDDIVEIPINEPFIVIASETSSQAENFILSIKSTIEDHNLLAQIFGEKNPQVIEVDDGNRRKRTKVWRTNAFITKDKTIVYGIGAGQRVRGRNIFGYRPTLFIVDDMYSQHNTKTEETRKKFDYWFKAEAMNSIDNNVGKLIWIGTMVHPDTVVKDFRTSELWKGLEQPIISLEELQQTIRHFSQDGEFKLPSEEEALLYEKNLKSLSWRNRHNLYSILVKYQEHLKDNNLNYFYQEYINEPIAPEKIIIKPEHFIGTNCQYYIKEGIQYVEFIYNGLKFRGNANLYIGLDPASSTSATSDDTVIIVAGYINAFPIIPGFDSYKVNSEYPNGKIFPFISHIEGGKYAIYNYEQLPGMVNRCLGICKRRIIKSVNIESNAQQIQIEREMRKTFREHNINTIIYGEFSNIKKEDRILNNILPIIQQHGFILYDKSIESYIHKLYFQLIALGTADHDDYPDALSIAWKNMQLPKPTDSIYSIKKDYQQNEDNYIDNLIDMFGENYWQYL